MRIANNLPALSAFNALGRTNNSLQNVIKQLSTGLRINSASDDAAGFAISEKMRSQISGLDTALRNSQDGISFLQTADGALEQTNSMLQRMRELAVQASNDSLTSNDRQYLQLEIDELKNQIDKISDTTQFNKKRLLDGSSGAIWSSSDKNLKAVINGGLTYIDGFGQKVSTEGNYRIEVEASGGQAQVQKSNIMTVAEFVSKTTTIETPITEIQTVTKEREYVIDLSTMLDNSETPASSGDGWEFTTDANGNNFLHIYGNGTFNLTGTAPAGIYIDVDSNAKIFLNDVVIDNSATGEFDYDNAYVGTYGLPAMSINNGASVNVYLSGNNTLNGGAGFGGLEVCTLAELTITSQAGDFSTGGTLNAAGGAGGAGIGSSSFHSYYAETITINGGTIIAEGGAATAGIGGAVEGVININGGNITAIGGSYSDEVLTHAEASTIPEGHLSFSKDAGAGIGGSNTNGVININITGGTINATGGTCSGTYKEYGVITKVGAAGIGGDAEGSSGVININSGVSITATQGETDFSHMPPGYLDANQYLLDMQEAEPIGCGWGGDPDSGSVNPDANLPVPSASTIPDKPMITYTEEVEVITGYDIEETTEEVTNYKTLKEISNFYNPSGKFLISQPQTLTITQGNGQTASVTLYEHDTMQDVAKKINDAIADDLGQARYTDNKNKFCTISDGTENSSESVYEKNPIYDDDGNLTGYEINSTMLIRSAIPGMEGEIYFSGDEDLLNALGLNTIQESQETRYTASVYDAHTGVPVVTNVKATSPCFKNLIAPNVDVEIDPMAGLKSSWDETMKRFIISHDENYSAVIHLKDSSTVFQIGANEGEDFLVNLGDSSSEALGISKVNVLTRETASRSIGLIDSAINKISSQRAKIGAYENALEHTMQNLTVTSLNLTAAESRIRDADMSKEMMELVKLQILNQSCTSMLAQANQLPNSVLSLLQ